MKDWRELGQEIGLESTTFTVTLDEARSLMLQSWDAWACSGDPAQDEILNELLATVWAMLMSTGLETKLTTEAIELFAASLRASIVTPATLSP
jgi:hypothetical protein